MKRRSQLPLWSSGPMNTNRRLFYGTARQGGATVIGRPSDPEQRPDEDATEPTAPIPSAPDMGATSQTEEQGQPS